MKKIRVSLFPTQETTNVHKPTMSICFLEHSCRASNYSAVELFLAKITDMAKNNIVSVSSGDGAPCFCAVCKNSCNSNSTTTSQAVNATSQRHYRAAVTEQCRLATHKNDIPLIKMLVESNYVNFDGISLAVAAQNGCSYLVGKMLDSGIDPDSSHQPIHLLTPLQLAARCGKDTIAKQLLKAGADVSRADNFGRTPLWYAVTALRKKSDKVAKTLLDAGADPNNGPSNCHSPFIKAVCHCRCEIVQMFVDSGRVDVNQCDPLSGTNSPVLHMCATEGYANSLQMATILLKAGANVNQRNSKGLTALINHVRECDDDLSILELFLRSGADVNARTNCGVAPAAMFTKNRIKYVRYHYKPKTKLAYGTTDGFTALEQAVCCGNLKAVQLLIDSGADVEPVWRWFHSPEFGAHLRQLTLSMQSLLMLGKQRQERRRLVALALCLSPLNLPVLAVYEIYLALPCHIGQLISRFDAWDVLKALKRRAVVV